ncbi:hypothetical protein PSTG_07798 [Puccinia striiformis f. sp. tritici PST-78]|uniref:Uncharacterized protein n=1 Tax=Puccinia striiformis f. sp. tritici PST-78 TaxID=1165861 RepID=A0A0L0VI81_9BASI|nr:hypothetical protein PSTG_07798 [Puccinia striiformis f. sp. tritici PST-78]
MQHSQYMKQPVNRQEQIHTDLCTFLTAAIPRTRIEYIKRAALQTRITNGTIVRSDNTGIVTNRTLAVSQIKGLDSVNSARTLKHPKVDSGAPTLKTKVRSQQSQHQGAQANKANVTLPI